MTYDDIDKVSPQRRIGTRKAILKRWSLKRAAARHVFYAAAEVVSAGRFPVTAPRNSLLFHGARNSNE